MITVKLKNFFKNLKVDWDNFIEKGKAIYASLDAYWRDARYGSRILPPNSIPQPLISEMTQIAEGLDWFNAILSLWKFFRDVERNIKKFFENLIIPYIYYITSGLYSFGLLSIDTLFGALGFCARTFISTCIYASSFINLLTTKTEEDRPSEEQEQIYQAMSIKPMIVSASLGGGIAALILGGAFIPLAVLAISVLTFFGTKATLSTFFPKAIPTAQKWVRRHEPLFLKEAKTKLKSSALKIKNWFLGAKKERDWNEHFPPKLPEEAIINNQSIDSLKTPSPIKAKPWHWDMRSSTTAEVRMRLPRSASAIVDDVMACLVNLLNSKDNLENRLFAERYIQRKRVLNELIVILVDVEKKDMENPNFDKTTHRDKLEQIYNENKSAFSYFGFGMGPVTALFKESEALLKEDIRERLESYQFEQIGKDKKYYENQILELDNKILKKETKEQDYTNRVFQKEIYNNDSLLNEKNCEVLAEPRLLNENMNAGLLTQVGLFTHDKDKRKILNLQSKIKDLNESKANLQSRLAYLNKSKEQKDNSIKLLFDINEQVDRLIVDKKRASNSTNSSEHLKVNPPKNDVTLTEDMFSNRKKLRYALFDQLVKKDPTFKSSIDERGERVQILDAILNKAYRYL